jgi:hypothetical protein
LEPFGLQSSSSFNSASQASANVLGQDLIKLVPGRTVTVDELSLNSNDRLTGSGTIVGDVINGGIIQPGNSPGIIDIVGNLTVAAGNSASITDGFSGNAAGTLQIEIAGKGGAGASNGHDQVRVTGNVALAGKLRVDLLGGFLPSEGDTFDIITGASFTGHFDVGTGLFGFGDRSLYFKIEQATDRIRLVATKVSADLLLVRPDTNTGADLFGQLLNNAHFLTSTVTFSGSVTVSQFVSVNGTLSLTWVPSLSVTLTDNSTTTVQGLTIGGAGLDVFVGVGGPYQQDSNGDGRVTAADTPNANAVGLSASNINFGLALLRPASGSGSNYTALSLTAATAGLVGIVAINAEAKNLSVSPRETSASGVAPPYPHSTQRSTCIRSDASMA